MFHVCLYYTVESVPCSLVIACWERADLLALLRVMFPCVFVTFPYGVLGHVWCLIISSPDLWLLLYFDTARMSLYRTTNIYYGDFLLDRTFVRFSGGGFRKTISASNKISKGAKIRNQYNQVPHLTNDTNGKVTKYIANYISAP